MGPKRADDLEEIRNSLSFMSAELTKVTGQLTKLTGLFEEVRQLKELIMTKDKHIQQLEKRIDSLEQYTRMDDVIISGLNVKPRSYARAAQDGRNVSEDAGAEDLQTLERQVLQFFAAKGINIDASNISACHTLPREDKSKPAVILRFVNRKSKVELLKQGRKLRGSDVYLNEHLTKLNAEIAREARKLKRNNKIKGTWTRNCRVLIQLNGSTPEQSKIITVRELRDLDKYK